MDNQYSLPQNQNNQVEIAENEQKFPYNIDKANEGK